MRRFAAFAVALGITSVGTQAAIVQYSLSGTTWSGTVVSGSLSYDTTPIILSGESFFTPNATDFLLSFELLITSIPANPGYQTSTTFNLENSTDFFPLDTDSFGNLTAIAPGFNLNQDGYLLDPQNPVESSLQDMTFAVDNITWQFTQVPELSHTALGAGLGLLGFVGLRAWRNRR